MPTSKKPRAFQVQPDKWEQRADAPGEYVADIGGIPPHATGPWIIRQRVAGKPMCEWPVIDSAPGAHKSEVEARVAVLNRGNPTVGENRSWGRLKKAGPRKVPNETKDGKAIPKTDWAEVSGLSVTQWVERLYADPKTSDVLREYAAKELSLTAEHLRELLDSVAQLPEFTDELIAAIAIQLWTKFGIHRAEEGRREAT
jgi:hypothetical protein